MVAEPHHEVRDWIRARRGAFLLDDPTVTELWLVRHADAYEQGILAAPPAADPDAEDVGISRAEVA